MSVHIESEVATPDEVAQELRVPRRTVLLAIRNGQLPAVKVGKQVRIAWADVARLRRETDRPTRADHHRPRPRSLA